MIGGVMAIYKVKQELTQTVIQTYWEEFDVDSQEQWESLKLRAEVDDDEFPEQAPSDPNQWFELYKKINCIEYGNKEIDDWISDRDGYTEYSFSLEDESGEVIASES